MKKLVFVVLLVALLLSFSLSVVMAGMDADDPCPPGYDNSGGHARCFNPNPPDNDKVPPAALDNHGKPWVEPPTPTPTP